MFRSLLTKLAIGFAFLIATPAFAATTYYVDAGAAGDDSHTCMQAQTIGTAMKTINHAATTCMSGGDTLEVRAGTYTEDIYLIIPSGSGTGSGRSVVKKHAGDANPVITGTLTLAGVDHILIDSIDINMAGYGSDVTDCVLINSGRDITITGSASSPMEIQNCPRHGILTGDGNGYEIADLLFDYLKVHNTGQGYLTSGDPRHHNFYIAAANYLTGPITVDHTESYQVANPADSDINAQNSWGIQIYSAVTPGHLRNVTVRNSYVHDNNEGITIGVGNDLMVYNTIVENNRLSNGEGAISVSYGAPDNVQLYNNTIMGNTGYCIELGLFSTPTNTVIKNNICYNNTSDAITDHGSTGTVASANLFSNPTVVNAATHDYHLQSSSAARSYGVNLFSIFTTDYDAVTRPSSVAWDAGAYQYAAGGGGGGPFTYYVDAGAAGNDSHTCMQAQTAATAKKTINDAVACMAGGDTLNVRVGTYNESLNDVIPTGTGFPSGATTIQKYSGDSAPTMNGYLYISANNNIVWDGINIDGTGTSAGVDTVKINTGTSIKITNATIANCNRNCIYATDAAGALLSGITLSNLTVHDSGNGSAMEQQHNIWINPENFTSGTVTIDNVNSYNAKCPGSVANGLPQCWSILIYSAASKASGAIIKNSSVHDSNQGIAVGSGPDHLVYNNIVYNNDLSNSGGEAAITIAYGTGMNNIRAYNNSIYHNQAYAAHCISIGTFGTPTNTLVKNNICYQNGTDDVQQASGTGTVVSNNYLVTDPKFQDAATGDFHLLGASGAIGYGTSLFSTFTTDREGTARPNSNPWDAGAYVYNMSIPGTPPVPQNLRIVP